MTEQLTNGLLEGADYATVVRRVALLRKAIEAIRTKPKVWYWDPEEHEDGDWIGVVVNNEMVGNGERVFCIDPLDGRPELLAFEWQVRPYSLNKPPAPDLAAVGTRSLHTGYTRSV